MKYAFFAFFALFFSVSALVLPHKVAACETYEQPCGGDEDRTKDDRDDGRRHDDIDGTDDRDTRHDNDDNDPAF